MKDFLLSSLRQYLKNPLIIIFFVFILVTQYLLEIISFKVNSEIVLSSYLVHSIWLAAGFAISVLLFSFFISLAISFSFRSMDRKASMSHLFSGVRHTHKVFVLMLVNILVFSLAFGVSYLFQIFAENIKITPLIFQVTVFVVYMADILGILIFLSFSFFACISEDISIMQSMKRSWYFVKKNYLTVLMLFVSLFIISQLVNLASGIIFFELISLTEIINFFIVYPLMAIFFSRFYNSYR